MLPQPPPTPSSGQPPASLQAIPLPATSAARATPAAAPATASPLSNPIHSRPWLSRTKQNPQQIRQTRKHTLILAQRVELGGLEGVVAPMIGKEPPDYHIWVQSGAPPAFIREEGPLYEGGPIWRMEAITPRFSHQLGPVRPANPASPK